MEGKEITFHERVKHFWNQFLEEEEVLRMMMWEIEEKKVENKGTSDLVCHLFQMALSDIFKKVVPFQLFVEDGKACFSISPNGEKHVMFLGRVLIDAAPPELLDKWSFILGKEREKKLGDHTIIEYKCIPYPFKDFIVHVKKNEEKKMLDFVVDHPLFSGMDFGDTVIVTFLFFDHVFGENFIEVNLSSINEYKTDGLDPIPLTDLYHAANKMVIEMDGNPNLPMEMKLFEYDISEGSRTDRRRKIDEPRGDIEHGFTRNIRLFMEHYYPPKGEREADTILQTGSRYMFASIDRKSFLGKMGIEEVAKEMVDLHGKIDEIYESTGKVFFLGQAFGERNIYFDFINIDGEKSIKLMELVFKEHQRIDEVHFGNF